MDKKDDNQKLHKVMKARHLQMIAIGGAIGTGLFFASGSAISQSGPGGAVFAFTMMGILVYFLMTSLGEMATMLPISGSFQAYANRFVDPALGFTLGWNYWFCWSVTVAAELVAGALITKFWFPNISSSLCAVVFLLLLFLLNILSAKGFAEAEFWFAGIKVVTIVIFLVVGVLMIIGIMGNQHIGFDNWFLNVDGQKAPFVGGVMAMINVFLVAGFCFQGTELVGLAAGESENPEKDVPKAISTVFWRILLFYVLSIIVIGFIIPFNDPSLLTGGVSNVAESPFTLVFANAGLAFAASLMNAVILTSVLSCGNSGLYAASRMLYSLALEGDAPKVFAKVNKRGVPTNALYMTTAVAALSFFASTIGDGKIYYIFYNISGLTGFFAWLGIAICHYRFRKAYIHQGRRLEDLKYKAKWYPFGPIFATILCAVVILGANIWVFQGETFSWFDFLTNYGIIPIFITVFLGYKYVKKTKLVPLDECNFDIKQNSTEKN